MSHGVRLREYPAERVPEHVPFPDAQVPTQRLEVSNHKVQTVLTPIAESLGPAAATLIEKDQPEATRERDQVGQEVCVIRARTPMQEQQGLAAPERAEPETHACALHVAV